jgi:hydrophobe/amphiphile efflux-1 (HAE1) family protein
MNISAWSIKRPIPTLVISLVLVVVGLMSFPTLGIDQNPNIDIPVVSITVTQPGAGPAELESQVTRKVEDAVAGLGNIDELRSTVSEGVSRTTINFILGTDIDRATNDVRNAVSQIRQDLPQDTNDPVVQRLEFAGGPIMTYAVVSERRSVEELSNLVDRQISRALLTVSGVAQIDRIGGAEQEISVQLNPDRLAALGITATQVNDQIRALNINLSGGRSQAGGTEKSIRTLGSAPSVDLLKNYPIAISDGESVPLSTLGDVTNGFAEPRQLAKFADGNTDLKQSAGKSVVAFSVLRSTGSTLVAVEEGVRKAVETLQGGELPKDIKLELIFTRADSIRASYEDTMLDLVTSCILTTVTVLPFLRNGRATLIAGLALPLSIIPTFMVMKLLGYTLNGMTLLALSIAVGNLVDDAVCMVEDIDTHLNMGKKPMQAALDASQELGLAVLATAATIVAVFLPVAFMGGVPGQFFQPFGFTIAISTIFSTTIATTVTPMLAAYFLKEKPRKEGRRDSLSREEELDSELPDRSALSQLPIFQRNRVPKIQPYRGLLTWALHHRITTILIAIAFFIGSIQLVPYIPKGLFTNADRGLSTLNVELPPGSTLQDTEQATDRITQIVLPNSVTKSVFVTAGSGGTNGNVNTATVYINLVPPEERDINQQTFEQQIRPSFADIPGARISFESGGGAGNSKDVSIILTSENPDALTQAANALEQQMREIPGLVEISSSASLVKPEILIQPDLQRAADLGVSVQAIARTANLATLGDNEANLAKFDLSDRQIPIRVQIAKEYRDEINTLQNLRVPSQNGALVPLSSVAQITLGSGSAQVDRFDRARQVAVQANLDGISLGDAVAAVKALPAMNPLPPSVAEKSAGDAKIMMDIFSRFLGALGLAVLCIYAILVLLYNNFLYPFTILVSLPLSFGGTFIALLLTQKELGLFALIGIVLLMGLVTKNAILLVDCALINQERGMPLYRAVVEAGASRLRPIVMTAVSTISGMLPIALEFGAGSETRSPMAIAVIGGFSTSTLLTLLVVPVLFTYVDQFQGWVFRKLQGNNRSANTTRTATESPRQ